MFKMKNEDGSMTSINEIYEKEYSYLINTTLRGKKLRLKNPIIKDYTEFIKSTTEKVCCIPSGIQALDKALGGGLTPGVYIFGANPGIGKTSLMLNMMITLALQKQHSVLFNLEMSENQILTRLLANASYRLQKMHPEQMEPLTINDFSRKSVVYEKGHWNINASNTLQAYSKQLSEYITILSKTHDSKLAYVETIETTIKNFKEILEITPVVMIDFLQLLQTLPKERDELDPVVKMYDKRLDINDILEKLKEYSNTYKVPIIIITSISRSSYTKDSNNDNDTEYNMSFGKESGNIEYMADFLALLTREKKSNKFGEAERQSIVINIMKSRTSSSYEKVYLNFIPEYAYFGELEEGDQL